MSTVHRVEALPGDSRYAVTFRVAGGAEQGVVAQVRGADLELPAASLPADWDTTGPAHSALTRAVLALHEARAVERVEGTLTDVDGGWDVGLGNVVLDGDGRVECVAHGPMERDGAAVWRCTECGARAALT